MIASRNHSRGEDNGDKPIGGGGVQTTAHARPIATSTALELTERKPPSGGGVGRGVVPNPNRSASATRRQKPPKPKRGGSSSRTMGCFSVKPPGRPPTETGSALTHQQQVTTGAGGNVPRASIRPPSSQGGSPPRVSASGPLPMTMSPRNQEVVAIPARGRAAEIPAPPPPAAPPPAPRHTQDGGRGNSVHNSGRKHGLPRGGSSSAGSEGLDGMVCPGSIPGSKQSVSLHERMI